MSKPNLIIVRGLPGSGKSTYAKKFAEENGYVHLESDDYLCDEKGIYRYTDASAAWARGQCLNDAIAALKEGKDVIVSNVFMSSGSINRYVHEAKGISGPIRIIRMTADYGNVHNVPEKIVNSMRKNFADYPGEEIM